MPRRGGERVCTCQVALEVLRVCHHHSSDSGRLAHTCSILSHSVLSMFPEEKHISERVVAPSPVCSAETCLGALVQALLLPRQSPEDVVLVRVAHRQTASGDLAHQRQRVVVLHCSPLHPQLSALCVVTTSVTSGDYWWY